MRKVNVPQSSTANAWLLSTPFCRGTLSTYNPARKQKTPLKFDRFTDRDPCGCTSTEACALYFQSVHASDFPVAFSDFTAPVTQLADLPILFRGERGLHVSREFLNYWNVWTLFCLYRHSPFQRFFFAFPYSDRPIPNTSFFLLSSVCLFVFLSV